MKKFILIFFLGCGITFAQDISWGETFNADFEIDSAMTTDGKNWQIAASGEAGPYGKAYLSYTFTNYFDAESQGEFTGFAWTQIGEKIVNGSLQGVWKKDGKVFKMYSLDNDSTNKVFNIVSGEVDFVAKTMNLRLLQ